VTPETPNNTDNAVVVITGLGLNIPVGSCTAQAYTAVRAGINRFCGWSLTGGAAGGEDGVAIVSTVVGTPALDWSQRAELLVVDALKEALFDAGLYEPADLEALYGRSAVSAHIAMPYEARPGISQASLALFQENARGHCVVALNSSQVEFLPQAHAAGILAVERAVAALRSGTVDVSVVIGIDTLLMPETLADMLEREKVKTDFKPSGLIPGEGAAILILERLADANQRQAPVYAAVGSLGAGREDMPFDGPEATRAEGMSQILQEVLATSGQSPEVFGDVLTDLNGERGRFQEWGLVEVRCLSELAYGWNRHHTADCTGDLGAATGVFLLGFGAGMLRWGHAAGQGILVTTAAEQGERACASLVAAELVKEG